MARKRPCTGAPWPAVRMACSVLAFQSVTVSARLVGPKARQPARAANANLDPRAAKPLRFNLLCVFMFIGFCLVCWFFMVSSRLNFHVLLVLKRHRPGFLTKNLVQPGHQQHRAF